MRSAVQLVVPQKARSTPSFLPRSLSGGARRVGDFDLAVEWDDSSSSSRSPTESRGACRWTTILLERVVTSQSQTPWHLGLEGAPGAGGGRLKMARAEPESYIPSVHQHLGDDDPGGPVSCCPSTQRSLLPAWRRLHGTGRPTQVPGTGCWMASTAGLVSLLSL